MHGNAKMTGGGLMKKDLTYNKAGKIVSKKMSKMAKKEMRLQKAGYITTKGVFGVKKMSGGDKNNNYGSPSSSRVPERPPLMGENRNINDLLQQAKANAHTKLAHVPNFNMVKNTNNRVSGVNPANYIYIDKTNNIVYKIGIWYKYNRKIRERNIRNEFEAYKHLMTQKPDDINTHFPLMLNCEIIPETQFALLRLRYIPNTTVANFNNNSNNKALVDEAKEYLSNNNIKHGDMGKNLLLHTLESGEKTFLWIDFEASSIKRLSNNIKRQSTIMTNLVPKPPNLNNNGKGRGRGLGRGRSLFGNNNLNNNGKGHGRGLGRGIGIGRSLFGNNNPSPTKKLRGSSGSSSSNNNSGPRKLLF